MTTNQHPNMLWPMGSPDIPRPVGYTAAGVGEPVTFDTTTSKTPITWRRAGRAPGLTGHGTALTTGGEQ